MKISQSKGDMNYILKVEGRQISLIKEENSYSGNQTSNIINLRVVFVN